MAHAMTRQPFNPSLVRVPPEEQARTASGLLTVSQVTALIKQAIESALPPTIHVVGEISNFKRHSSGHLYFTLKDRFSELSCVMWRSSAEGMKFQPGDGLEVIATGTIELFERAGRYQLYVRKLEPRGVGAIELAFRQLHEKLAKEGLFDERRKRPLPNYPKRIVVVTSPTGVAIADILRTIERRFPCVHLLVYPVRVQGPGAAAEIAGAIRQVNANSESLGGVDVMIVGRGGGSLEDLWPFNEEVAARAIHASRIPIVSGVGHEIDVTIADLVADVRAATPTAAAELVVPVLDEVLAGLASFESRLLRSLQGKVSLQGARLSAVLQRRSFRDPPAVAYLREQYVDEILNRIRHSFVQSLQRLRRALDRLEPIVQRIAPHAYLLRRAVVLRDAEHKLHVTAARRLVQTERVLERHGQRLERVCPINAVRRLGDLLTRFIDTLTAAMNHRLALCAEHLRRQNDVLGAMGYKSVLGRGFSITRLKRGRTLVRSRKEVHDGQRVVTAVGDGEFESQVVDPNQLELFE
jgi:exodeoxyribonuclease VII large subunit